MALPVLVKTWQYNVNQTTLAGGTWSDIWFKIKQALIGFVSAQWTVVGSSNSVTAGMDATDRWLSSANVMFSTEDSPHSWIVLKQTGIASNYQVCLNCISGAIGITQWWVSRAAGFTGGSITNRPTAADEVLVGAGGGFDFGSNPVQSQTHVLQSTDGTSLRIAVCASSICFTMIICTPLVSAPTIISPSVAWFGYGAPTDVPSSDNLTRETPGYWRATTSSTYLKGNATIPGTSINGAASSLITVANDIDSAWDMYPLGLSSNRTDGAVVGYFGRLVDIWTATATTLITGTSFGTKTFAKFGQIIVPWDGSTPLVS